MEPQYRIGLRCIQCEFELAEPQFAYTCPDCGSNLTWVFDYPAIARTWSRADLTRAGERSLWRYLPLLPVKNAPQRTGLQVGATPLIPFHEKAPDLGLKKLWIKDDARNPSSSLKDRASELAIQHATETGHNTIIAASTGNAGASLACLAAYHGKRAILVVPAAAPAAKLVQIRQHGAWLLPVAANYDTAFDLARQLAEQRGLYCRNTAINPILAEGKKTVALEIAEQLEWKVPDAVVVTVGDGCIISGVYRGFEDLLNLGWIDRIPHLIAVQAEGSAAIVNSLENQDEIKPVESKTIADSISVDNPRDGVKARMAIRNSNGTGVTVSDAEILTAQLKLSQEFGLFMEPASAAGMAGLMKLATEGKLNDYEDLVLLQTGSGLKDIPHAQMNLPEYQPLDAYLDSLVAHLSKLESGKPA